MKKIFFIVIACLTLGITSVVVVAASMNSEICQSEKSSLTYNRTELAQGSLENGIDVYLDTNKNEYLFNDKGEQIGFKKSNGGISAYSQRDYRISLDDAIVIANEVLREINAADRDYTMTEAKYFENMQEYSITYHYFVDGYRTSDFAFVNISPNGVLTAYAAPNMGSFDNVVVPEINKSEIEKTVADYITRTYDCKDYSIDDMILVNKEELELSVLYSVTLTDNMIVADAYNVNLS